MEASFVILDQDPLRVSEVDEIKKIEVLSTIKEGNAIYTKVSAQGDVH